jgi:DNA-binding transcriptional LysR family regulator
MEIRELRYFVAVAEELHFARAAARVGIEQSPLSKAITEMELDLGVKLFVRTRRSTRLTYVGETLLEDARRILAEIAQARRNIRAAASGRRGRIRIAIGDGLADPRIARLLARSHDEEPEVDIQVMHVPFHVQLRELRSRVLDVGFALSPGDDRELRALPLWNDAAMLVMQPKHPLCSQSTIRQIDTDVGTLILLAHQSSAVDKPVDARLMSSSLSAKSIEYVASMELLLTLVAAGYGTGLISAAQAETFQRSDLVVRPLGFRGATITTYILFRHDPSSLVARFNERAQKTCEIAACKPASHGR